MKRLTQIFQALLGVAALIFTALIAAGRLAWRTIRTWWKKRSKWLRRMIATILIVIPVGFIALIAYAYYDCEYGRSYWRDESLSKDIEAHGFRDSKYRVYNRSTDKYTTPKVNWISDVPDNDSLAVYAIPNKRGYINANTGEIIIDAETNDYRKAWVFSEGLAAVMKDGMIGFININNEVVIPFQYDYSDKCCMWNFGYLFHNGYCTMTNAEGDQGLIDREGHWVIEPAYDEIWTPHETGYRIIVDDGKYGVLDAAGSTVYPAEYRYIDIVSDGFVLTKGGRRWQVDFDGKMMQPFMFDDMDYIGYPIGYDDCGDLICEFSDYAMYEIMHRRGIMNRITGKPVTLAIYSDIYMLSKDLFKVQEYDSCDWYLIDTSGNIVGNR